jgi:hypothetical protein
MKTNGTYQRRIGALAGLLLLVLSGCTGPFLPKEKDPAGTTIPPGMGLARINLSLGGERTVLPSIGTYYFTLKFSASGQLDVDKTLTGAGTLLAVALAPATWTLEVNGYADSGHTDPEDILLTGSISVPITAGTSADFDVYLTPNLGSNGLGSLHYDIDLDAFSSSPTLRAWLGLYPLDAPGTISHQSESREINISPIGGSNAADTIADLPEGTYRVVVDLYDGSANKAAVRTEVVHIYNNLTTSLIYSFASEDFAECPPVIEGYTTLAGKLNAALGSASGSYTIVLGSETDLAEFIPMTLNVTGNKNINITIRGNGTTVQVAATGTPLLTLEAAESNSLSLELRDITLTGKSGNSVPVVQVDAQGTLSMKTGSCITGNSSTGDGGGVYVNNGTLSMSGGSVSGNFSGSAGGGVYVNNGTLSMSGGSVSGNSSDSGGGGVLSNYGTISMSGGSVSGNSSDSGGGVFSNNGTMSMSGGSVSDNNSSGNSGGVYVQYGAMSMSGGSVSGNTASNFGGGMCVYGSGTLNMSGGSVSGNNSSGSGGGVYVFENGTMGMSGGMVRDNALSGANSYGREVLVFDGTFNISGDAMPQRVFLYDNFRYITISGPLSGGLIPIDLGITSSTPLVNYVNVQILRLDSSYTAGDLAELQDHFSLGNSKFTSSPYTEEAITGHKISDDGRFVVAAP